MKLNKIVNNTITLPEQFHSVKNKSIMSLIRESGYMEERDKITDKIILNAIKGKYEIVKYWQQWSEDKRTTEGWYFKQKSQSNYEVGYLSDKHKEIRQRKFTDIYKACAYFIKMEIDAIIEY